MKERRENKNERKKRKNKWEKIDRNRQKKKKTNIMKLNKILRNRERRVNDRERKKKRNIKEKGAKIVSMMKRMLREWKCHLTIFFFSPSGVNIARQIGP